MLRRAPLALLLGVSFVLGARAPLAWCDDPPPEPAPTPDAPAEPKKEEPKKEKVDHDDTSVFKDWRIAKQRGIAHSKKRAEFWEGKGASGKDLNWVASLWNRGEEYGKAAAAWEKFLEWTPPAGEEKAKSENEKNREYARKELIAAYLWGGKYPETVKAAQEFRTEFGQSPVLNEAWVLEGRAQRLAGDNEKAIAAFSKAAEGKLGKGLFDLLDLYMAEGQIDEARAAIGKFPMEGRNPIYVDQVKAFLELIGTDAPGLEKAVNVGTTDVTPAWKGKATACYLWHMQLSDGVRRMQFFDRAVRDIPNVQTYALATYHKLNPQSQKIEQDMTEEKEIEWYRKLVSEEFPRDIPYAIVVPKEALDAMGMKNDGQMTVVDADGKLRWMRLTDQDKYDRLAVALALKKLGGAKKE